MKSKRDALLRERGPGQKDVLPESLIVGDESHSLASEEEAAPAPPPPRLRHGWHLFRWFR